jgi:hypothetical protein
MTTKKPALPKDTTTTSKATGGLKSLKDEAAIVRRGFDILDARLNAEEPDLLVTAQALILCGLPYKPVAGAHYQRQAQTTQGLVRLTVGAMDPKTPLPYGKDRVVLAWVTTKAMQTGNPCVEWASASEYFETFGLDNGGTQYRKLKQSWERLAKATMLLEVIRDGAQNIRPSLLFERADLPTLRDKHDESDRHLVLLSGMKYGVELGHTLWEHLQAHPIPLPLEVMREYQNEPMAWDVAAYLSWRSHLCQHSDSVARIAWRDLMQQLGSEDTNRKRLRTSLKDILTRLRLVWPELRAEFLPSGVLEIRPPARGLLPGSR